MKLFFITKAILLIQTASFLNNYSVERKVFDLIRLLGKPFGIAPYCIIMHLSFV